jgi:hypothetical protein
MQCISYLVMFACQHKLSYFLRIVAPILCCSIVVFTFANLHVASHVYGCVILRLQNRHLIVLSETLIYDLRNIGHVVVWFMNPKARWQLPTGWCSWMIFLSHCNACDELFIWLVLPEPVDIIELNIRRPHQLCKLYQVGCGNGNACIVEVDMYVCMYVHHLYILFTGFI